MDINSQQQINTFVGGMNTDTSDAMLDSSQYRDALNLRIVTNTDSNSGELHLIEGTQPVIELDEHEEILKITGIRDYGILIVRNHVIQPDKESYTWSIYRFKKNNPGQTKTKLFGPCSTPIWETESVNGVDIPKCTNLSVICNYESEENIKLYIADGIHEIMCINIYNTPSPPPPYEFKYIRSYADNLFPKPNVQISPTRSGQVRAAKVLYYYRLYSKYGQATKLSQASSILSLYKDNATGYDSGAKSGRAIEINIPSISGVNFEYLQYIQIYRINYVTNGQVPEISLIIDLKYTEPLHVIDEGSTDIEKISVSEFLSMIEFGIVPKNLEVKNNYLFASNLKYKQSEVDLKFKDLDLSNYFEILRGPLVVDDSYRLTDELLSSDSLNINATYRPGETYRFGVIFYDDEGNASSVFHLEDVTIPDYSLYNWINMSGLDSLSNALLECLYEIFPPAIKIKLKNETIPGCSKYEIVRCVRTLLDKRTISQGLLGRPLELFNQYDQSLNRLASSGFFSMGYFSMNTTSISNDPTNTEDRDYDYAKSSESVLLFTSPEYVYQPDDCKNIIEQYDNKLKICPVAEYASKIFDKENIDAVGYTGTVHAKYTNSLGSDTPHSYRLFYNDDPNSTSQIRPYNTIYADSLSIVYNDKNETDFEHIVNTQNGKTSYASYNTLYPSLKLYYITRIKNGPLYDEHFSFNTDKKYSVEDISYSDSPEWNQFATENTIRCFDDVSYVGGWEYHNWSNIFLSGEAERLNSGGQKLEDYLSNIKNDNPTNYDKFRFPIGTGGECMLLSISNQIDPMYSLHVPNSLRQYNAVNSEYGPFLITVADLRKDSVPYGGNSDYAKRHSVYYSYGDVFDNVLGEHKLTSGDCYIRMFKYNALHMWWDPIFSRVHKMSTIYCVPIFTDIDLHGEYGITFNRNLASGYKIQDKACKFDKYIQYKDAYLYNTAYNVEPTVVSHSAYDRDYIEQNLYDNRVHYSEQKTNNEIIDSWTKFKAMNFLDVDSRFGLITDTKLFKDKLIFWLEHAVGILAVNERVILQDSNETQVTLGTGAILDRYDYISTIYGMKPGQRASCVSNDALYWWDGNNKEILQYVEKYSVTPLAQVKNIRNYINSYTENNHPHIYYDRKYKEIVCQCVNDEAIAYNELLQRFTSRYSTSKGFLPTSSTYVEDVLLLASGNMLHQRILNKPDWATLFDTPALPKLKWVVNKENMLTKTYDMQIIGGSLYGGSTRIVDNDNPALFQNQPNVGGSDLGHIYHTIDPLRPISIIYNTPLKLTGEISGKDFTNREYDYRLNIPRENEHNVYGGRLRGKTMQCELSSNSNSTDFSLQYIITKYRMSWS